MKLVTLYSFLLRCHTIKCDILSLYKAKMKLVSKIFSILSNPPPLEGNFIYSYRKAMTMQYGFCVYFEALYLNSTIYRY